MREKSTNISKECIVQSDKNMEITVGKKVVWTKRDLYEEIES